MSIKLAYTIVSTLNHTEAVSYEKPVNQAYVFNDEC